MNKYNELINIIVRKLKEEVSFKEIVGKKYCIYGPNTISDDERFIKIDFRIEEKVLIISWLFLSKSNTGCGYEIIKWFEKHCKECNLDRIEIKVVNKNNKGMINFTRKLDFKEKDNDGEYINFIKFVK